MFDFDIGVRKTYYEVCAYDKPENFIVSIKYFDNLDEARKYCEINNNSIVWYGHNDCNIKCKLAIVRIDSEVIQ